MWFWLTLLLMVYLTPAMIVACSSRLHGARKRQWLLLTLLGSWVSFLAYLTAVDREFLD